MLYVVTGHPRSGTSMMMAALRAGGCEIAFSLERERQLQECTLPQSSGFNPSGVWELTDLELNAADFPLAYDGKCIKLVWQQLKWLPHDVSTYRVINMWRHPEEVHQSFEAAMGGRHLQIREVYAKRFEQVNAWLMDHVDVLDINLIGYNYVLEQPNQVFQALQSQGWPITDWQAAARVPDRRYYRFRRGQTIVEGA